MLYTILEETAKASPSKTAVICGQEIYDYAKLKHRADRLAGSLQSLGIEKNDKIAIIHKNCHRFLETYFAAAKLGAILVPINFRLAPHDFIHILNDAETEILIAQPNLIGWFSGKRNDLKQLKNVILTEPDENNELQEDSIDYEKLIETQSPIIDRRSKNKDKDIAQIYYTSGTTGRPKGVILTHRNNHVHADWAVKELVLSSEDRWLHVSPMFHLADAWAVWSITQAAGVHVMTPDFDPERTLEAIAAHKVTLSNFIPTMLNLLVNFPEVCDHNFSSLRLVLSGGAPIAKEVIRKVIKTFGCSYIQTYGLTETSPFLTMSILKKGMEQLPFEERLNYMATTGRPFAGVQLKVVKENRTPVMLDEKEAGEIIVKGDTITPGYWRLPEESSRRIVDGWLHTGDIAVVNSDGYVTIVDRKDDMIITGGENVYSIEVEDILYSHSCILEAAVIGLPDPVWGETVTAVVVAKSSKEISENDVIKHCEKHLASFKVPKKVIFTHHIPKTGSSKIYKYQLRQLYKEK